MSTAYISGMWLGARGPQLTSLDPSTGEVIWQGASASVDDVTRAFAAAKAAFASWAATPLETRIEAAMRFKEIISARKSEMAQLIAQETGKVLWDASGEAGVLSGKVDLSIKAHGERTGEMGFDTAFGRAELGHRAHGVMAVLGPYNFPAHLPNGQILPALIAGNTIVFKPSEQTPAVGAFLIKAYADAGFPEGVINLVQGGRDTGAAILNSPDLDGLLFTGSAKTGAFIHKHFGGRPDIVLALEMGGNNPLLVWDISDPIAAASHILQSAFITTGQRCTCARRLIVPTGKAGDRVVDAVLTGIEGLSVGAWNDDVPAFMGPLISADIARHVVKNADALGGMVLAKASHMERGDAFLRPGVIDVTGIDVADEEIFGPVLQVIRVDSFDEGLARANATRFGLAAGLLSDDEDLWTQFKTGIRAGVVNFNRPTTGASGALPFGGPGASGNHNPGAFYAADFCAWPMASQINPALETIAATGLTLRGAS